MFLRPKQDIHMGLEAFRHAQVMSSKGAVLLDVRTPGERKYGYLPGSVNLPLNQLKSAGSVIPDFDTPVFIYCANGARAQRAAKRLMRAGYKNVLSIGGLEGYRGEILKG